MSFHTESAKMTHFMFKVSASRALKDDLWYKWFDKTNNLKRESTTVFEAKFWWLTNFNVRKAIQVSLTDSGTATIFHVEETSTRFAQLYKSKQFHSQETSTFTLFVRTFLLNFYSVKVRRTKKQRKAIKKNFKRTNVSNGPCFSWQVRVGNNSTWNKMPIKHPRY